MESYLGLINRGGGIVRFGEGGGRVEREKYF